MTSRDVQPREETMPSPVTTTGCTLVHTFLGIKICCYVHLVAICSLRSHGAVLCYRPPVLEKSDDATGTTGIAGASRINLRKLPGSVPTEKSRSLTIPEACGPPRLFKDVFWPCLGEGPSDVR